LPIEANIDSYNGVRCKEEIDSDDATGIHQIMAHGTLGIVFSGSCYKDSD